MSVEFTEPLAVTADNENSESLGGRQDRREDQRKLLQEERKRRKALEEKMAPWRKGILDFFLKPAPDGLSVLPPLSEKVTNSQWVMPQELRRDGATNYSKLYALVIFFSAAVREGANTSDNYVETCKRNAIALSVMKFVAAPHLLEGKDQDDERGKTIRGLLGSDYFSSEEIASSGVDLVYHFPSNLQKVLDCNKERLTEKFGEAAGGVTDGIQLLIKGLTHISNVMPRELWQFSPHPNERAAPQVA